MMMPVLDGQAAIAALAKLNPAVRIIAASGLGSSTNNPVAGGPSIVKGFLSKPYTADAMLKTLRRVLDEAAPD